MTAADYKYTTALHEALDRRPPGQSVSTITLHLFEPNNKKSWRT